MKRNFIIRVSGLVQGVYFRASAKDKADALNISGFVRNEPDGSVYIEAEGEEEDLRALVDWCKRGPSRAKVEKCEVSEGVVKGLSRFVIKH